MTQDELENVPAFLSGLSDSVNLVHTQGLNFIDITSFVIDKPLH
jgi:hypothetical protein